MKTVIFVWTQKLCNVNVTNTQYIFGIGDMLRGTVGALRYCEKRGYECIIDISLHPLSQLLLHKRHRFSDLIQSNKNNIKYMSQLTAVKEIDAEIQGKDLIYFFSNFHLNVLDTPASESIKKRVRELLTPNEYLESYISTLKSTIPFNQFGILHFRVGDDCLILQKDNDQYSNYLNIIKSANPDNQRRFVLMSDSAKLKELAKSFVFSLDGPVTHIGADTDIERLKHTFAEFFILRDSLIIFTHSAYFWTSGFVKFINYIYNVPLTNI